MTVVPAQVTEPSAARARLDDHRQGLPLGRFVGRAHLLEKRRKACLERRPHMDIVRDVQCEVIECGDRGGHKFLLHWLFARWIETAPVFGARLHASELAMPETLERAGP